LKLIVVLLNYSTISPLTSGCRQQPDAVYISVWCQLSLCPADHPLRALTLIQLFGRRTVRMFLSSGPAFSHTKPRQSVCAVALF